MWTRSPGTTCSERWHPGSQYSATSPPPPAGPIILALLSSKQDWWGLLRSSLPSQHTSPQFPLCPGRRRTTHLTHCCITSLEEWSRLSPQDPSASLIQGGIWASDFPAKRPGNLCSFGQAAISVHCAILWGKNHHHPHVRLRMRGQGHTEACKSGYFTQELSTRWRLPHKVKSPQGALEALGLPTGDFNHLSLALPSGP